MAHDYSAFLPQVIEYAVDSTANSTLRIAGRDIGVLTEEVFLDRLYVARRNHLFENRLYESMVSSTQLTCVAAHRGCGKTSAIHYAVARVSREHPTIRPLVIDVKQLYVNNTLAALPTRPTEEALSLSYTQFKTEIRKIVQQRLLPGPEDARKLLAWTLAGRPDDTDSFSDLLVSGVIDLSNAILVAANAPNGPRTAHIAALERFLQDPQHFAAYHGAAMAHIATAHVVRAAMQTQKWSRIVLIFDNIDRIAIPYQLHFMEAVNDTHNALAGSCGTVVAIRRETLRMPPRDNEDGDPIDIIAPNDVEYPAILFPDTTAEHVREIFQARHQYSSELYQTHVPDAPDLAAVSDLHNAMLADFGSHSIHALANGSIRALGTIYSRFLRDIVSAERAPATRGNEHLIRSDEGFRQTVFFLFLREHAQEYGLIYHEIVRTDVDHRTAKTVEELASLHHLVLTALLNLTKGYRPTAGGEHYTSFGALAARLGVLGFSVESIRVALSEMCAEPGEPPRTVEFLDFQPSLGTLPANSAVRVRLTALGHVLVTSLLHKVGYVWGQAHDVFARTEGRRQPLRAYYELEPSERVHIFFTYVREVARNHLKLLSLVRSRLKGHHGKGWLDVYRSQFSVDGLFQIERLCESAAAFYAPQFSHEQGNPFRAVLNVYRDLVREIQDDVPFDKVDLPRLRWRPEDFYGDHAGADAGIT